MLGAIIGDIVGSRFEWTNHKSKEFRLFDRQCRPTDDSIMSLAVAKAILEADESFENLDAIATASMQELGRIYRNVGYGPKFAKWIWMNHPKPYNSFGNGSAMRVGACGFAAKSLEEAKKLSAKVTEISHNHPEGMKGAEAVSSAIFLARNGKSKEEIQKYILDNYYQITFTLDRIRKSYKFDVSCQGSVPVAFEAFFEASDFEDAIRGAISVGGDSDTIAAITGSIAEAYFGIPEKLIKLTAPFLDQRELEILCAFEKKYPSKALDADGEPPLSVFDVLCQTVDQAVLRKKAEAENVPDKSLLPDKELEMSSSMKEVGQEGKTDENPEGRFDALAGARKIFEKTGSDLSRTAQWAGKGLLQAVASVKGSIVQMREKAAAKTVNCHALRLDEPEDTEALIAAEEALRKAGYKVIIQVRDGMMYGYVFVSGEDFDKTVNLLAGLNKGVSMKQEPEDREIAEQIMKQG